MKLFGTSNLAVRSLSGVLSVLTLPVAWLVGRNYGRQTAVGGRGAAGQRAVRGLLRHRGAHVLAGHADHRARPPHRCPGDATGVRAQRPRPRDRGRRRCSTPSTGRLYLVATLALWLLWQGRKGQPDAAPTHQRPVVRRCPGGRVPRLRAMAAHLRLPVPPHRHALGGAPGNFGAVVSTITGFTDNQATLSVGGSNQGRLLAIFYLVLAFLAVFGAARDRWHIDLDLHTRPRTRSIAFVVVVDPGGGGRRRACSPRAATRTATRRSSSCHSCSSSRWGC